MLKVDHISVMNFENAIRGARNPLNSWGRMDSFFDDEGEFVFGENDISPFEFTYGENYIQFTVKACEYTFDDGLQASITMNTKIKIAGTRVYRVVALE